MNKATIFISDCQTPQWFDQKYTNNLRTVAQDIYKKAGFDEVDLVFTTVYPSHVVIMIDEQSIDLVMNPAPLFKELFDISENSTETQGNTIYFYPVATHRQHMSNIIRMSQIGSDRRFSVVGTTMDNAWEFAHDIARKCAVINGLTQPEVVNKVFEVDSILDVKKCWVVKEKE